MKIAISMEMTRVLRDTWHAALNHEWYHVFPDDDIIPLCCHGDFDIDAYDIVILAGGNDMPGIRTWRDNHYPARDEFERRLLHAALVEQKPVIGVCRGAHFLNAERGGTLAVMETPYDNVEIELPEFSVRCHHTIQIEKLAPGWAVLQQDSVGVVECAWDRQHRLLGIGWHPERQINAHTRHYVMNLINQL